MLRYWSQSGRAASDSVCTSLVLWKLCPADDRPCLSGRDVGIDGAMSRRWRTSSRSEMTRCENNLEAPPRRLPLSQTLQTPVVSSSLSPTPSLSLAHSHTFIFVLHPIYPRLKIPRSTSPCNARLVFQNDLSAHYPCPFLHRLFFRNIFPLSKPTCPISLLSRPHSSIFLSVFISSAVDLPSFPSPLDCTSRSASARICCARSIFRVPNCMSSKSVCGAGVHQWDVIYANTHRFVIFLELNAWRAYFRLGQ